MATKWNRPMRRYRPEPPPPPPPRPEPTVNVVALTGGKVHRGYRGSVGLLIWCTGRHIRGLVATDRQVTCGSCEAQLLSERGEG